MSRKIGFLSGTFDPVHGGHIALAKETLRQAKLDQIYFIPEASPRRKDNITPLAERVRMLELAISIFPEMATLVLPDEQLSPNRTVPELQGRFPGAELFLITGSDMLAHMPDWEGVEELLKNMSLVVGLRGKTSRAQLKEQLAKLPTQPLSLKIIRGELPASSSSQVRTHIVENGHSTDISPAVEDYIKRLELYTSSSPNRS